MLPGSECFKCDKCPKTYEHKNTLNCHLKNIQVKPKEYKCGLCHYEASYKISLQTHHQTVHEKLKPFQFGSKFECTICFATFSNISLTSLHT